MRKSLPLSVLSAAVLAAGCRKGPPASAMNDDLRRDLQLATSADLGASATRSLSISPDELGPQSKPTQSLRLTPKPGPKVIRSSHPHLRASRQPREAADVAESAPPVEATAPAADASPAEEIPSAPPMARPTSMPAPDPGPAAGASTGGGSGIGSVLGGIAGILIRGTIIGGGGADGDHCEPRGGRSGRGGVYGNGGVYGGNPRGIPGDIYGGNGGSMSMPRARTGIGRP